MHVYGAVLKVQHDVSQVRKPSQQQGTGLSGERSTGSLQHQSPAGNGSRPGHKSSGTGLSGTLPERTPRTDDGHDDWRAAVTSSSELIPQARKCIMDAAFSDSCLSVLSCLDLESRVVSCQC